MQEIPIIAIANQTLNVDLEERQFTITLKEAVGCMVADVVIDGVPVITGSRVLAGEPIIPFAYLQDGNFILSTMGEVLPFWDEFGVSQHLFYLTNDEMA